MVKNENRGETENQILDAARKVFQEKGLKGARMQEIADLAGINKAMLHYYFRSKDMLFQAIYAKAFEDISLMMNGIFQEELPLFEKIRKFVDHYITFLVTNPFLPAFIVNEAENNPDFIQQLSNNPNRPNPSQFLKQIKDEVEKGNIKPIAPIQLQINMVSMCIFPVMARHVLKSIGNINDDQYHQLIEQRKTDVADFIINAIKND